MQSVLIYTIGGIEGSYGGLTSLCKSHKIDKIIHSVMIRAKDCASDPNLPLLQRPKRWEFEFVSLLHLQIVARNFL